jgi:hypothetical protein
LILVAPTSCRYLKKIRIKEPPVSRIWKFSESKALRGQGIWKKKSDSEEPPALATSKTFKEPSGFMKDPTKTQGLFYGRPFDLWESRLNINIINQVFDLLMTIMVMYQKLLGIWFFILTMMIKFDTRNDTRRGLDAMSNTRHHSGVGGVCSWFLITGQHWVKQ